MNVLNLSDENQCMVEMMKMKGCRIEWEMFGDGSARVKTYFGDRDYPGISVKATTISEAVASTFKKWDEITNKHRAWLDD